MSIPAACATNTDVSERYSVLPSRLKLYPVGRTNATIRLGTPIFSSPSNAFGRAASELVVENAMSAGSLTASMNLFSGTPVRSATGTSTATANTRSAP